MRCVLERKLGVASWLIAATLTPTHRQHANPSMHKAAGKHAAWLAQCAPVAWPHSYHLQRLAVGFATAWL